MMKKILTYMLISAGLIGGTARTAVADTEYMVFALNTVSNYTQKATAVVNDVSLKSQQIASYKITPGGYLGDKAAEVQEKVELTQEKVENAEEKRSKIQDRMEWAKESKQALMDKYNNLNSKLSEYKEEADKAIAEGKSIRDQYKTYKDQTSDALDQTKEAKDQVSEGANTIKETAGAVENMAESKIKTAKEKSGKDSTEKQEDVVEENEDASEPQKQPIIRRKQTVNKAEAISSAGKMAQAVSEQTQEINIVPPEEELTEMPMQEISVDEIIAATKDESSDKTAETLRTDATFEEQLVQGNTPKKAINIKSGKEVLTEDKTIATEREKFQTKAVGNISSKNSGKSQKRIIDGAEKRTKESINEKR
ncbi:MAG: hypothetical protein MJ210_00465 [Alphaproteobacteria bacterium]|nr:hypothetical protein [Alphaproteobacteria bacterium]